MVYLKKWNKWIDFWMPIDKEDFTLLYQSYCKKGFFHFKMQV